MKDSPLSSRLAVCSWSLQPDSPQHLLDQLKATQINRVQIALDPIRTQPGLWSPFQDLASKEGVDMVSGMFVTVGEDYSTMESIRLTGGIVPDTTWEENWANIQSLATLASTLKLPLVTFHAGFLPHDQTDPQFQKLLKRVRLVADVFAAKQIDLALETGQETAPALTQFLETLDRGNVGVNFDPANMLLYDKGDPIEALKTLAPWLKQCHLKDASKTTQPGAWGAELPVGAGQVDWPGFFQTLGDLKFTGYLAFEREAGNQRLKDIQAGKQFTDSLLAGR